MVKRKFALKNIHFLHLEATKWVSLIVIMKFLLLLAGAIEQYLDHDYNYFNKDSLVFLIVLLSIFLAFSVFLFFHSFRHSYRKRREKK